MFCGFSNEPEERHLYVIKWYVVCRVVVTGGQEQGGKTVSGAPLLVKHL